MPAIVRFIIKEYLYKSNMAHWRCVTVFYFISFKPKDYGKQKRFEEGHCFYCR